MTCYFCHSVVGVEGTHNAQLRLAADTTCAARSTTRCPHSRTAPSHRSTSMKTLWRARRCAARATTSSCPRAWPRAHVQRVRGEPVLQERDQQASSVRKLLELPHAGSQERGRRCTRCARTHRARAFLARHRCRARGVPASRGDAQRDRRLSARQRQRLVLLTQVSPPNLFTFLIETNAGHNQPSGAAQDRRMWLEFLPTTRQET